MTNGKSQIMVILCHYLATHIMSYKVEQIVQGRTRWGSAFGRRSNIADRTGNCQVFCRACEIYFVLNTPRPTTHIRATALLTVATPGRKWQTLGQSQGQPVPVRANLVFAPT